MTRFTLVVRPDGRALLATEERLDEAHANAIVQAVKGGRIPDLLVFPECAVVQVSDIDVDIPVLEPKPTEVAS